MTLSKQFLNKVFFFLKWNVLECKRILNLFSQLLVLNASNKNSSATLDPVTAAGSFAARSSSFQFWMALENASRLASKYAG